MYGTRTRRRIGAVGVLGLALWVVLAAFAVAPAQAQEIPQDNQYGDPLRAASGPAAGAMCLTVGSGDGVFGVGDYVEYEGEFDVASGASVVIDDADGTQGTFIDGVNATITDGSIRVEATGDPLNVAGGNGVLNDTVCNSIVTSTGISADTDAQGEGAVAGASSGSSGGAALSVLPDTSGPILGYAGALIVAGAGMLLLRYNARR